MEGLKINQFIIDHVKELNKISSGVSDNSVLYKEPLSYQTVDIPQRVKPDKKEISEKSDSSQVELTTKIVKEESRRK